MKTKKVTVADLVAAREERDTYRDLCGNMVEYMQNAKQLIEMDMGKSAMESLSASIKKAKSILGEKNGTAN